MNGLLSCVDFMGVIMGDIPYITTLNGLLSCVDFMGVIMGDIPPAEAPEECEPASCQCYHSIINSHCPRIAGICLFTVSPAYC